MGEVVGAQAPHQSLLRGPGLLQPPREDRECENRPAGYRPALPARVRMDPDPGAGHPRRGPVRTGAGPAWTQSVDADRPPAGPLLSSPRLASMRRLWLQGRRDAVARTADLPLFQARPSPRERTVSGQNRKCRALRDV